MSTLISYKDVRDIRSPETLSRATTPHARSWPVALTTRWSGRAGPKHMSNRRVPSVLLPGTGRPPLAA
jgi:hypothetical protein